MLNSPVSRTPEILDFLVSQIPVILDSPASWIISDSRLPGNPDECKLARKKTSSSKKGLPAVPRIPEILDYPVSRMPGSVNNERQDIVNRPQMVTIEC